MQLGPEQIAPLERDGDLFFPGLSTPDEARKPNAGVPDRYARGQAFDVREEGSDAVRSDFAAHLYSQPFAWPARRPRMVEPRPALFGRRLYMHQFRIKGKMTFEGDVGNPIRRFERPAYIVHHDFTPVHCRPDDCLLKACPAALPWRAGLPASALQPPVEMLETA